MHPPDYYLSKEDYRFDQSLVFSFLLNWILTKKKRSKTGDMNKIQIKKNLRLLHKSPSLLWCESHQQHSAGLVWTPHGWPEPFLLRRACLPQMCQLALKAWRRQPQTAPPATDTPAATTYYYFQSFKTFHTEPCSCCRVASWPTHTWWKS